jgi:hypothetical protein
METVNIEMCEFIPAKTIMRTLIFLNCLVKIVLQTTAGGWPGYGPSRRDFLPVVPN